MKHRLRISTGIIRHSEEWGIWYTDVMKCFLTILGMTVLFTVLVHADAAKTVHAQPTSADALEKMSVLLPHASEITILRRKVDEVEFLSRQLRDRWVMPAKDKSGIVEVSNRLDQVAEDMRQVRVALNRLVSDLGGMGDELNLAEERERREKEAIVLRRLKEIQISDLKFAPPTTLADVIDYFLLVSKEAGERDKTYGVSFTISLQVEDKEDKGSSIPAIVASNISLYEALRLVCAVTGYRFEVEGGIVHVMPKCYPKRIPCGQWPNL